MNTTIDHNTAKKLRTMSPFDNRNLVDKFKGHSVEDIKTELKNTEVPLKIILSNNIKDFNLATAIRNANGFNISEVFLCGRASYDRRGTVGTHHYTTITHNPSIEDTITSLKNDGYRIVAAEYDENYTMQSINDYKWDRESVIVFGEEGMSIPHNVLDMCDDVVFIPMFGSVRSFNLGTANGIFLNSYRSQHS